VQQFVYRLPQAEAAKLHGSTDMVRGDRANEVLAVTGGGDGADPVLGVGSGSDDRGVAHATRALVRHAAGRGGGGEITSRIERDRAYGAVGGRKEVRHRAAVALAFKLSPSLLGAEVAVRHQRQPFFQGEFLRARPDQQNVPGLLHHAARELDRISHVPYGRDGARPLLPPLHDGGVELRGSIAGERRTPTGIEERVVFQRADGGADRIEARATLLEPGIPCIESSRQAVAVPPLALGRQSAARHRAGAAVNGNRKHGRVR